MARFYLAEMVLALHALHTMGYVHRLGSHCNQNWFCIFFGLEASEIWYFVFFSPG